MEAQTDFKELLALFNVHKVEYLICGAYALAFYGAPRYTGDLDILVRPEPANAERVIRSLKAFGFGELGLTATDFTAPNKIVQLGVAPVRIDIVTSLTGITWEEAAAGRTAGSYGGLPVSYIGKDAFIRNKKALGRNKDKADIDALEENRSSSSS